MEVGLNFNDLAKKALLEIGFTDFNNMVDVLEVDLEKYELSLTEKVLNQYVLLTYNELLFELTPNSNIKVSDFSVVGNKIDIPLDMVRIIKVNDKKDGYVVKGRYIMPYSMNTLEANTNTLKSVIKLEYISNDYKTFNRVTPSFQNCYIKLLAKKICFSLTKDFNLQKKLDNDLSILISKHKLMENDDNEIDIL